MFESLVSCNKIAKWRNGRREGLKNLWGNSRAGSSPALATDRKNKGYIQQLNFKHQTFNLKTLKKVSCLIQNITWPHQVQVPHLAINEVTTFLGVVIKQHSRDECRVLLTVRNPDFHSGNGSSILPHGTNNLFGRIVKWLSHNTFYVESTVRIRIRLLDTSL